MKRNTLPAPPAPAPVRTRAPRPQAAQPSLFAPEPAETEAPPARTNVKNTKNAKTNPVPKAHLTAIPPASDTVKDTKQKTAKTDPAPKTAVRREQPVRIVNDPVFEGGSLWKMSGKNGVAYIKDAALAGELLAIDPKKLARAAMAVYYDKKGRAFAWQVRFDTDRWEELMRRLG